jgi:hypothetical protein
MTTTEQAAPERPLHIRLGRFLPRSAFQGYYDRKQTQGKKHNSAVICLSRARCDVIFAMLKNCTLYEHGEPRAA